MKGWQSNCLNHCFRYYICWPRVNRKLPDNYAVKQLLRQLVEGVRQLAFGHSTDKHHSVERVSWQGQQQAYRHCTNKVPWQGQQLAHRQRTVRSEPHYSTSTVLQLSCAIIPACCQSALMNFLYCIVLYYTTLYYITLLYYTSHTRQDCSENIFNGEKHGHISCLSAETACRVPSSSL
jgi:hypothetical protein